MRSLSILISAIALAACHTAPTPQPTGAAASAVLLGDDCSYSAPAGDPPWDTGCGTSTGMHCDPDLLVCVSYGSDSDPCPIAAAAVPLSPASLAACGDFFTCAICCDFYDCDPNSPTYNAECELSAAAGSAAACVPSGDVAAMLGGG